MFDTPIFIAQIIIGFLLVFLFVILIVYDRCDECNIMKWAWTVWILSCFIIPVETFLIVFFLLLLVEFLRMPHPMVVP